MIRDIITVTVPWPYADNMNWFKFHITGSKYGLTMEFPLMHRIDRDIQEDILDLSKILLFKALYTENEQEGILKCIWNGKKMTRQI